jgi:hypothetical protein
MPITARRSLLLLQDNTVMSPSVCIQRFLQHRPLYQASCGPVGSVEITQRTCEGERLALPTARARKAPRSSERLLNPLREHY